MRNVSFADHTRLHSRQSGLSLVELMIAMALGLVLTFGVIQIFSAASQTYRLTDRVGQLQEDMRFILGRLQNDGRMAGHYGCLIGPPTNNLNPAGTGFNNIIFGNRAISGWDANDSGLGDSLDLADVLDDNWGNGAGEANPVAAPAPAIRAGTDFFVINGAERTDALLDGINGNQVDTDGSAGINQGEIVLLVSNNCLFGDLLQKTSNSNANNIAKGTMAGFDPDNTGSGFTADGRNYVAGATAYQYRSTLYYIGTAPTGEPGLYRQILSNVGAPAQELVSGVESMQVLYGVSTGAGAPQSDQYVTAANVTDWSDVVSMRIALLMRSANPVQDVAETRTFNLLGTEITTASDRRARLVGTTTIAIRNRLQ